jgi:TolB-like protein/Tfp pilus assembly protein PilF
MGAESAEPASTPIGAVFLSYASQDAAAAEKICSALRAAGIEVWFDQSELRGGDAWDQKIRHEIHDCALFIPVVSQHTQERLEGYFRHEWKLAIERAHHMAEEKPFLVPVVVDGTRDQDAFVPDAFRALQWTRLPGGDTPPAFVERIRRLLSPELAPLTAVSGAAVREKVSGSRRSKPIVLAVLAVVVLAALAYLFADRFWISKHAAPTVAAFSPPPHSIAVLPFVNMSGDKEQEYFSEGLTEELLNSLSRINELQVAARTSSFSFQGEHPDIATVAQKLNVGAVLEGSVRRSAHTVRVTTQLVNGITGFHLWSETYDRDLGDVLKLQTEIATAVASALKVALLEDAASKIELGGTRNPAAFDAYLRGSKAFSSVHDAPSFQSAAAAYTEAIRLDPNYALAFAGRSAALSAYGAEFATGPDVHEFFDKAEADARQALKLAPELAEGHLALARFLGGDSLDFTHASEAYERAMALAPGNADVLREGGRFAAYMGRFNAGLAAAHRAVALDPLNPRSHFLLGQALFFARRYEEAVAVFGEVISLSAETNPAYGLRGLAYYELADFQTARSPCETKPDYWYSQWCLAVTYDKLGRHADAEAELKKLQVAEGDAYAYQYATIYAQWGNTAEALEWLETAMRVRDPGLIWLKTDPLMDPLRQKPRFQAVMRELRFPD